MVITEKLKQENLKCCGCTACYAICPKNAITMHADSEGFKYPVIDKDKCIDCGLCCKVCPLDIKLEKTEDKQIAVACTAKYENFTKQSSSGGVFAILANMFIKKQAVIYGAAFDDDWTVKHIRVDQKEDLKKLYTSKYVQSDMSDNFKFVKADLDSSKEVLFAGTPCQVVGLKSYLGKDYNNLTTVDFICHGVPSPSVWKCYINEKAASLKSKITDISFRDKKDGWNNYYFMIRTSSGNINYEKAGDNIYMNGFLKDLYLRPSCYDCKFKTLKRASDITLADFWGIDKVLPEMYDKKGVSLCWTSSKKGSDILAEVLKQTVYKKVDLQEAVRHNPSAIKSVNVHKNREKFFKAFAESHDDVTKLIEKYYDARSLRKRLSYKIRTKLKSLFK